ncbi:MAG: CHASE2 domain-containing protein, partial [Treponema sp.]|nr:CHASE2 domain-containing protein [Treponema sp.]
PWPRSVMADGLLRLKEYGAAYSIFDIEYIDSSPTQVDELYLKNELKNDFDRHFSEISLNIAELLGALAGSQVKATDTEAFESQLLAFIEEEKNTLYRETQRLTRDNDAYLSQSMALFGKAWATLNMQSEPLSGEQASRRPMAEEKFSYPVKTPEKIPVAPDADVLGAIPPVMKAAVGAGYTNATVDKDGIRRRILLTRRAGDYWYLQLAFAPLIESMGRPELELYPRKLVIKQSPVDIVIPLDKDGAMLLDWPKTSFEDTFTHVSFAELSYLEDYQKQIIAYTANLATADDFLFPALFMELTAVLRAFDSAGSNLNSALENSSEEDFAAYVEYRGNAMSRLRELFDSGLLDYIQGQGESFAKEFPESADDIMAETRFALDNAANIETVLGWYEKIESNLKKTLKDKIIIIGRSDTGTTDKGVNPFYGEYVNVGTHGALLDTIVSRSFIIPMDRILSAVLCFILTPLILLAILGLKPGLRIAAGILGVVLIPAASLGLFIIKGIFLGPLGPTLALLVALIIRETLAFVTSEKEKQFIRNTFSTYISGEVVQEILNRGAPPSLGGEVQHMSAIFTDIRGFSTISENLSQKYGPREGAKALVHLLNRYLSAMSNVVLNERGVIDKYEGDAIIAFFGAPVDIPDHAYRACISAITIKRIEADLNSAFLSEGLTTSPLLTRIGINTGSMVVGNMGTESKMNYTIMGNAVNLASRLEGANKQYGTWILATGDTVKEAGDSILSRRLDRVRVKGIEQPVQLFEIMELKEKASQVLFEKKGLFEEALDLFEKKDWDRARKAFAKLSALDSGDEPSNRFIRRCIQYKNNPPPEGWDGVFNLTQK